MDKKPIRIFIVDDHPMVIEGLSVMLHETPGIEVAGYATNAASCLGYFVNNRADVVLMDINLPDESGIDLCLKVKHRQPDVHILGLSTVSQLSNVRSMKKNGACGYLLKNASRSEIINAIEVANEGGEFWGFVIAFTGRKQRSGITHYAEGKRSSATYCRRLNQ